MILPRKRVPVHCNTSRCCSSKKDTWCTAGNYEEKGIQSVTTLMKIFNIKSIDYREMPFAFHVNAMLNLSRPLV